MRPSAKLLALGILGAVYCTWLCNAAIASPLPPEPNGPPAGSRPSGPRTLVVISDLHFGSAGPGPTSWHAFEDFRWKEEFEQFLHVIDGRGQGPVDIVVAGDMFELWQSANGDCPPLGKSNLGCSEEEAEKRLNGVLEAHEPEMRALKAFASHDDNRLIIIPGNHDSALLYPKVTAMLRERMADARFEFAAEGYWLTADGRVLVEHGHQVLRDANWFQDWPKPFIDVAGEPRLRRTAGENFVRAVFNKYEAKYPIIDNITDEGLGIKLVAAQEGAGQMAETVPAILKHILLESTWAQLDGWLGTEEDLPEWDYEHVRNRGVLLWGDVLPPDDPGRTLYVTGETQLFPDDFSKDELRLICDAAAGYRKSHPENADRVSGCRPVGGGLGGDEGGLGQIVGTIFRNRNKAFANYLIERQASLTAAGGRAFDFYVFGHTHRAEEFSPIQDVWKPTVVNDGAWHRLVGPRQLEELMRKRSMNGASVLALAPEDLPAEYDFVIFEEGMSQPKRWCWFRSAESWELIEKPCPR